MREAASRGFWVSPHIPYGYRRVHVQDGAKQRPRLDLDPPADAVVRRIFQMACRGKSVLDIVGVLNDEGVPTMRGGRWSKNTVHGMLTNEAYTGTLVWGVRSKDKAPPMRVEDAFPAIVTRDEFERANRLLQSRAPKVVHPRRASSPYLLSGLARCESCGQALTAAEAKSGRYTYYVCQSLIKRGRKACETPRLNAKRFEETIIGQIRDHILTESNIRDLVRMMDEEMDGVAAEQRERLESIELELTEERKKMERIWRFVESTDLDFADASDRIKQHRDRQQQLEVAAEEARAVLAERRDLLDRADTIATFAQDMGEFLRTSEITETRAFVRSFVKQVLVGPGQAVIHYTLPTPEDSPIGGADAAEIALAGGVMSTRPSGSACGIRTRDLRLERAVS